MIILNFIGMNNNDCLQATIRHLSGGMLTGDGFLNHMLECGLTVRDLFGDTQVGPDALDQFLRAYGLRCHMFTYTYGRYDYETSQPTINANYQLVGSEDQGQYLHNFLVLVNSKDANNNVSAGHYYCINGDELANFRSANYATDYLKANGNFRGLTM